MDTRQKIVPLDELPALLGIGQWLAVVGRFDPLTAIEAKRLADFGRPGRNLLALVLDAESALLPANARAELVAGLRDVHLVAITKPDRWRSVMPNHLDVQIVQDPPSDQARSAEFIEFVINRQQSAATSAGPNE